eukprot:scaffold50490_cov52-Attheya_sp.AAC.2
MLDKDSFVVGRVLEGMDVVERLNAVIPSCKVAASNTWNWREDPRTNRSHQSMSIWWTHVLQRAQAPQKDSHDKNWNLAAIHSIRET